MGLQEIHFLQAATSDSHCQVILYGGVIDGVCCKGQACPCLWNSSH